MAIFEVGGIVAGIDDEPWRYFTTPFVHDSLAYQFVTLVSVGVFGSLLERRFGWFAVVFVFLACGAAGAAAAVAADIPPPFEDGTLFLVLGANGAALGLLSAWYVEDRRAGAADAEAICSGSTCSRRCWPCCRSRSTEASSVAGLIGRRHGRAPAVLALLCSRA